MREDAVHIAVRNHLRSRGWSLLAGQFPGGSDDELRRFYVRDPRVARDRSPDPRRHSLDTFAPDLLASRGMVLLIVEMKPRYSVFDAEKLRHLIDNRYKNLTEALVNQLGIELTQAWRAIPALGFAKESRFKMDPNFTYFLVGPQGEVQQVGHPL